MHPTNTPETVTPDVDVDLMLARSPRVWHHSLVPDLVSRYCEADPVNVAYRTYGQSPYYQRIAKMYAEGSTQDEIDKVMAGQRNIAKYMRNRHNNMRSRIRVA